jgi:hypothetical protein
MVDRRKLLPPPSDPVTTGPGGSSRIVESTDPGLGRYSGFMDDERVQGGLPDDPVDNPVRDDQPFRVRR